MRVFACMNCGQTVFFESVQCTRCGHVVGFLPDRRLVGTTEPMQTQTQAQTQSITLDSPTSSTNSPADPLEQPLLWRAIDDADQVYRLCRNQVDHGICNWLISRGDDLAYCRACRLNHTIPNLDSPETKEAWHRMEIAKRRLLYTLFELDLPVEGKAERPDGLQFEFLKDSGLPGALKVLTGHENGVITINVAEADDPFREKMRVQMGETYRTLLGHFRHEIGHYFWDRLIKPDHDGRLTRFRELFGDERADYADAAKKHYSQGAPAEWMSRFVSAYASMHPWEDWAETWAHYLHIVDTLETAHAHGVSLRANPELEASPDSAVTAPGTNLHVFEDLIHGWIPLTTALNNLNRSMGLGDCYPFVLSAVPISKLRFVHSVVESTSMAAAPVQKPGSPIR